MTFAGIIDRYARASTEFERVLRSVREWTAPTPCPEWDVRALVNHMTRGNLNYALLAHGGTAAEFLRLRDVDALGNEPVAAYASSVQECTSAFVGALDLELDYPLGRVSGAQALAVRTTDSVIHTWDLARACSVDDTLDAELVAWIDGDLGSIYAGLAETPVDPSSSHRFFAAPVGEAGPSRQDRLLHRMGRLGSDGGDQ